MNIRLLSTILFCSWFYLWNVRTASAFVWSYDMTDMNLWFYSLGGALASTGLPWYKDFPKMRLAACGVTGFFAAFCITPTVAAYLRIHYAELSNGVPLQGFIAFFVAVMAVPILQSVFPLTQGIVRIAPLLLKRFGEKWSK